MDWLYIISKQAGGYTCSLIANVAATIAVPAVRGSLCMPLGVRVPPAMPSKTGWGVRLHPECCPSCNPHALPVWHENGTHLSGGPC